MGVIYGNYNCRNSLKDFVYSKVDVWNSYGESMVISEYISFVFRLLFFDCILILSLRLFWFFVSLYGC